jgi:hypothetical protein
MKARLLTPSIVLWLLSISTAICFLRMSSFFNTETAAKKKKSVSTIPSEDRDKIIFLWHIRPPPL